MVTPINQAPPEFMSSFIDILLGREKLETLEQVVRFWIFAIEQGKPHPEMRECIADLTVGITRRPDLDSPQHVGEPLYEAYRYLLAAQNMWQPDWQTTHTGETMEEFYDRIWDMFEHYTRKIQV